jgi:hypothetical protein
VRGCHHEELILGGHGNVGCDLAVCRLFPTQRQWQLNGRIVEGAAFAAKLLLMQGRQEPLLLLLLLLLLPLLLSDARQRS